ncbi:MAG: hypothetical protein ACFE9S_11625 [Candidatus Hermodarchaeota archaeon]
MSFDLKKEKRKDKKEKKTGSDNPEPEHNKIHQESEKKSILSMLDKIDNISKAKTLATEEKIRKELIKSESTEEEKKARKKEIAISEVKKKIEELHNFKQNYLDSGENAEAIEISKKIINIAKVNGMNLIVNEEKGFIEQIKAKIGSKKPLNEQIEQLKRKRHDYYTQEKYAEAIKIAEIIIELATEANLIHIQKTEENFIKIVQEKLNNKVRKAESFEDIIEERAINQQEKLELIDINKFNEEKLKFEEEKEDFRQKKLELEEQIKKFQKDKQKFEEEKKAFKWEKEMYEEAKRAERDKFSP